MAEKQKKQAVSRRMQREIAVQLIFEMKAQQEENMNFVNDYFIARDMDSREYSYVEKVANTYINNLDEIEQIIKENITGWRVERVGKTEISIIRVATVELLYFQDVPPAVSINEAVEISKRFSEEISYKFVNKVLRNIFEAINKNN